MIIVLALLILLSLSYQTVNLLESISATDRLFRRIYIKEKQFIVLNSLTLRVIELLKKEDKSFDALTDIWARSYEFKTPLGTVSAQIVDEDRFINPNYLTKIKGLEGVFDRLLFRLDINPELKRRILIWTGQEEGYLDTRYPLKRAPMNSIYEIELFWEKKEDLYGKKKGEVQKPGLYEFLTTFSDGKININTAPLFILASLEPEIDWELAKKIDERRREKPFKRVKDILLVEGVSLDTEYRIEKFTKVRSRFFRITLSLEGEGEVTTYTVVYDRDKDKIVYRELK